MDCGKPLAEARADIDACVGLFEYYAELANFSVQAGAPLISGNLCKHYPGVSCSHVVRLIARHLVAAPPVLHHMIACPTDTHSLFLGQPAKTRFGHLSGIYDCSLRS